MKVQQAPALGQLGGDMETVVSNLVNLGIGGCMAGAVLLLLWHQVRVAIPERDRENRALLREQQAAFTATVGQLVTEHRGMLREQQAAFASATTQIVERLEALDENATRTAERL